MSDVVISGIDHSNNSKGNCCEGTSLTVRVVDLTAANFDAQIAAAQALQTAIQGVSLIAFNGIKVTALDTPRETVRPTSPYAQRESKWQVTFSDTVTDEIGTFEIGGADLTLTASDGKTLDISAGAGLALVTAMNTNMRSRDGNPVVFVNAVHVGRNT